MAPELHPSPSLVSTSFQARFRLVSGSFQARFKLARGFRLLCESIAARSAALLKADCPPALRTEPLVEGGLAFHYEHAGGHGRMGVAAALGAGSLGAAPLDSA